MRTEVNAKIAVPTKLIFTVQSRFECIHFPLGGSAVLWHARSLSLTIWTQAPAASLSLSDVWLFSMATNCVLVQTHHQTWGDTQLVHVTLSLRGVFSLNWPTAADSNTAQCVQLMKWNLHSEFSLVERWWAAHAGGSSDPRLIILPWQWFMFPHSFSAEWAKGHLMVFKTGQVEWSAPRTAREESIQQLIVLFISWPFQRKLSKHICTFIKPMPFVVVYWIFTLGRGPEKLQSSAVYATEQLHWSSCWRASQQ